MTGKMFSANYDLGRQKYIKQCASHSIQEKAVNALVLETIKETTKKYTDFGELTPAMINGFVSKIVVHKAEKADDDCKE